MNKSKPVILAITAASGIIYGVRTLEFLLKNNYKVELIISSKAYYIFRQELGICLFHDKNQIKNQLLDFMDLEDRAVNFKVWLDDEFSASPASGSYLTKCMLVVPASMASVASMANGFAENLITRAVDVILKERRPLVISPRETPFSSIHLENMLKLSQIGVRVVPPIMGFYGKIATLEDGIDFVVGKILDSADITNDLYNRWGESPAI